MFLLISVVVLLASLWVDKAFARYDPASLMPCADVKPWHVHEVNLNTGLTKGFDLTCALDASGNPYLWGGE